MAEPQREDYYYNYQNQQQQPITYTKSRTRNRITPSTANIIVLATLVPFGATLLILAGLTLTATVIGLAVTTPLFVIFSPVLFAAAVVVCLAIAGFLTSGAFGVTSLSSFAWLASYLRRSGFLEQVKVKHRVKPNYMEDSSGSGLGGDEAQISEEARDRVEVKAQETVQPVAQETVKPAAQSDQRQVGKSKKDNVKS